MTDYINSDLINPFCIESRNNIVLYNPRKGFKFTKKIIDATPMIEWKPLTGMNIQELLNAYGESKLYVDFGYHPGKDRIPREAAINGCCVITGIKGSANFFEDVSICDFYKINENTVQVNEIVEIINDILENYEKHIENYEF